jgi:glucosamine-6-phosphate deaminase
MIRLHVHTDKAAAVRAVAADIARLVRERAAAGRRAVLGLATGSTPIPLYAELVRLHREEGLSFRGVTTFNLDEYSGLGPDHDQSYRWFMQRQLFDHVDVVPAETHVPDGLAKDVAASAAAYEDAIRAAGGIDLQVLGIGRTGHIGFNEPPAGPATRTRQVHLDELTRRDNASFFGDVAKVPHHAVTMGVGTILDCRRVVLLAWGEGKADIVRRSVEDAPSDDCPASWLQRHAACDFVLDAPAAAKLARR